MSLFGSGNKDKSSDGSFDKSTRDRSAGPDAFGFRRDRDTGETDESSSHAFYGGGKGEKHGHIVVDTNTGDIKYHREPGNDYRRGSTTWDE